jgi:hypothetical protein
MPPKREHDSREGLASICSPRPAQAETASRSWGRMESGLHVDARFGPARDCVLHEPWCTDAHRAC